MTCRCGSTAGKFSSRCDDCQRKAILTLLEWTEEKAEKESSKAYRELLAWRRGRGRRL